MESWKIELYAPYLAHHGIDGQEWGKRNGPPYPLKYKDLSSVEKKKMPLKDKKKKSDYTFKTADGDTFKVYGLNNKEKNEYSKKVASYNNKQKKQDERLYGKTATKRIEKRINEGEGVLSARHDEVKRKNRREKIANKAGKVFRVLEKAALATATVALTTIGAKYVADKLGNRGE